MNDKGISRRGFLKVATALGAALAIGPTINKVQAAERIITGNDLVKNPDMQYRTLGTGSASMEVSALGFGVMGMTYNRSQYPSKEIRHRVIAEAVDRGVNLFDIGIIYGPLTNEIFTGEALAPYKNKVNPETIRKAHAVTPVTAIQSEYHLMHRLVEENGVLDICEDLGIGFVPYSPINRGFLGGCINEYTVFDTNNDNRNTLPRFQPEAMRQNYRIVNVLQDFGRTRGMTSAQVALGWLLHKAPWIVPIPGTTKVSHLEENLHTFDFALADNEWDELERRVAAIPVVGDRYNAEQQKQVGH